MDYLRLILAMVAGMLLASGYLGAGLPSSLPQSLVSSSPSGFLPYHNCAAARAAGAAPVYRGQPGYATWLDRDNDGVGCE